MAKKLNRGQGVGALFSKINPNIEVNKEELVRELSNTVADIPLDQISFNPDNPRLEFDEEALLQLSESIKKHGLIQPITVRHLGENQFQLISGERRLRASKLAALGQVPAYIRVANDEAMLELALIENIQRQDLNAIEIASTYQRMMDELKLTEEQLSKRVNKKRSTVSNYVRLLRLPGQIQNAIKARQISMGHARALAGLNEEQLQSILFEACMEDKLSVRKVEQYSKLLQKGNSLDKAIMGLKSGMIALGHLAELSRLEKLDEQLYLYKEIIRSNWSVEETRLWLNKQLAKKEQEEEGPKEEKKKTLSPAYQNLQDRLKSQLGAKVQLKANEKGKGQIIINFMDPDDLERILEQLNYEA
ncbi:ParB/RepB/Spo0J family partition protein [Saprospira sp. CCB-QB6]|uniref:ParB/RepB/Spo0J family partition protein n=1 Tax=Saprospira sp. CCB-QB6 TaxID=3023936 RepID=UPI002349BD99|nr:ParB/RepB/Spo0J family partition protein [Saprospira sp. CCB-QB6]WCL82027.1 ParB/RepB/Spo0J family partition protein [Saprospira sp. CCB-QB6]